jgi:glyoxylase-like metal-dependent hydrolase (beta-lactamase superfamily II)
MVEASVTLFSRGRMQLDPHFMKEGAILASRDDPNPTIERLDASIHNAVIDHPAGTFLWDTGSHPDAAEGYWPDALYNLVEQDDAADHELDDDLAELGYDLDDIDYVIQSHLHHDHAGGLTYFEGTDTPVLVHEEELKFAYYNGATGADHNPYVVKDFHRDLNWRVLHRDRTSPFEGIEFIRCPGHTPGMVATVVHCDDPGTIVFAGDASHLAFNYENEHPIGGALIDDKHAWVESVRRLRELEREYDAEHVIFGHDTEQFERLEGRIA